MAFAFDSEQFNQESTPRRLGNWEVPRWAPSRPRPLEYRPDPKPICDVNGHFLPGAPRGTSKCFGHYTGTWELPKRITREVAAKLSKEPPEGRFPDWLHPRVQRPEAVASLRFANKKKQAEAQEAERKRIEEESYVDKKPIIDGKLESTDTIKIKVDQENEDSRESVISARNNLFGEKKEPVDEAGHGPYVPGSVTDPDKRHESYDLLVKDAVEKVHGPQEDETDKFWKKVHENARYNENNMKQTDKKETLKLPQVNVSHNFHFAKRMHVGNLEHQPLPDTLGYRNLTRIGEHRDSDIVVKPYAIGWKGYGASGPTCCTKMRVHRPKTSDPKKADGDNDDKMRPSTSAPDLGQVKKPMSLMDLAICWDFRPNDPKNEPRPTKHIDGSNGCRAPAVFTMIHTPKEEIEEGFQIGHSNPIFNQNRNGGDVGHHPVPYFEKDMQKDKRNDTCEVQYCPQHESRNGEKYSNGKRSKQNSASKPPCDGIHGCGTPSETSRKSSRDSNRPDKQTIKNGWTREVNQQKSPDTNSYKNSLESYDKTALAQGKLHQSSPNDSQLSRRSTKDSTSTNTNNNNIKHKHCSSCNGSKPPPETKHREDYKLAFKAGNPNSVQSVSSTDSKGVKMPKMRHPYTKKSYSIPTLAPPFSIWKDANATGYPEHWRLASVYQHAYKPLDQRRKPLISCVYQ